MRVFVVLSHGTPLQEQLMARDVKLIKALRELKREKETIPVAYRLKTLKSELAEVK